MMLWHGGHWAFWQAGMMWAEMILFLGLLILGIFALISFDRRASRDDAMRDARRILDERLARGEISPEEHQRILDLLSTREPRSRVTL